MTNHRYWLSGRGVYDWGRPDKGYFIRTRPKLSRVESYFYNLAEFLATCNSHLVPDLYVIVMGLK